MRDDRSWMYDGWTSNGMPTREWMVNTQAFVDHIFSLSPGGGLVKCPCNKCQNCSRQVKIDMERHLCKWVSCRIMRGGMSMGCHRSRSHTT
jgi:hypothetical protein